MSVKKAVIPVAGWGTRFLPVSKAVPKVLMPLVDRAAIQYVIEEAAEAGIEQGIIVAARGQEAIIDYFDRHLELERSLAARDDSTRLSMVRGLSEIMELTYVRQAEQLGLGHAVLCAARAVGNEPFAVILPDDIIASERGALSQLLDVYNEYGGSVIAVEEVPGPAIQNYGVVSPEPVTDGVYRIRGMVEKPAPQDAPSNLGVVGRYVLTPEVFDCLTRVRPGAIGEIQLTDGIGMLLESQAAYALRFEGTRYDVGNPLGLLKASVSLALQREDMGPGFAEFLRELEY